MTSTLNMQSNNSKKVVFKVIMPCYNSENYVEKAINSITGQTYQHWKLIAINDGSTDNTLNILNSYASNDNRISVFSKPNGGYVSAVNYGLDKISDTEDEIGYFLLLGSDDTLETNLFNSLAENISDNLPDCVAFRTTRINSDNTHSDDTDSKFHEPASLYNTTIAEYIEKYPEQSKIFFIRDTSKCFKCSLVENLRYFGKYGLDADGIFSMLLCHNASSFMSVPVYGYNWNLRDTSLSGRKTFPEQERDRIKIWTEFYTRLDTLPNESFTKKESDYLDYFYKILISFWRGKNSRISDLQIIRKAAKIIKKTHLKRGASLTLYLDDKVFFISPLLNKLFWGEK